MKRRVQNVVAEASQVLQDLPDITHLGNPILRQKCTSVSIPEGKEIAKKLIKTLTKYREIAGIGAGLAAPQIGIPKCVFVTFAEMGYETYINPTIVSTSDETNFYRESCISSRVVWGEVERPASIEIKWTNEQSEEHTQKFSGFMGRLLQHEYDHLLGVPCLDKAIPGTIEYAGEVKDEELREASLVASTNS